MRNVMIAVNLAKILYINEKTTREEYDSMQLAR
jgi:hypothetical protein